MSLPAGEASALPPAAPARGRILYLTVERHAYTLAHWFDPPPSADDPEVVPVTYEAIARFDTALPEGTYVFTDTDRLSAAQMRAAVRLAWRLARAGENHRLANWPNRVMNRVELLTVLHRTGQNGFACRRLIEHQRVERFPVFVRLDGRHGGAASDLLHEPDQLRAAIMTLLQAGVPREELLIVEYQETDRHEGLFLAYSAFCAFGQVHPSEITAASTWLANASRRERNSDIAELERDWVARMPEVTAITEVFRRAGVDWGRIDYGFSGGKLQVFEINTNPDLCSAKTWDDPERRPHWLAQELPAIRACFRRLAHPGDAYQRPWDAPSAAGSAGGATKSDP
jgi:hypothetical protein